jgi:DNA-binding HxlR family transcriptional regulator
MVPSVNMVTPVKPRRSGCPISFGLDIFGDGWTLLVLRDLLLKDRRTFRDLAAGGEGIATNILTDRLKRLEAAGLVGRAPVPGDRRQAEYRPTPAGRALVPVLMELAYWGSTLVPATASPPVFLECYEADRAGLLRRMAGGGGPEIGS